MKNHSIISIIFLSVILITSMTRTTTAQLKLSAEIVSFDSIAVKLPYNNLTIKSEDVKLQGAVLKSIEQHHDVLFLYTSEIELSEPIFIEIKNFGKVKAEPGRVFDKFTTEKKLGWEIKNERTNFNIFAPRASMVKLVLFDDVRDEFGKEYFMSRDTDGVWRLTIEEELWNKYYVYRVDGPQDETEMFDANVLIADPYSTAVASKNSYEHESRTLIHRNDFDWENTGWVKHSPDELVIYEMHVRDMTAHSSSQAKNPGSYLGLTEKNIRGGINYLKELGVNAVELLPVHDFANWEIPYKRNHRGFYNSWNPYERNHWGYMSTYFFAPESYYSSNGKSNIGEWNGTDGRQVHEFKEMVKTFHKEGIAVILDVVYNHCSQYDWNPFKYIDKKYYFGLDSSQNFLSFSGCGNDTKTERPLFRKLILESIIHWMTEYKIDGFRFDLAQLIDRETCELIIEETKKINPNVIIIAEPWGGGYDPAGFSKIGWAAWNDVARNGIKGENPFNRKGFIFGNWDHGVNTASMKKFFSGTLEKMTGLFQKSEHSINYLESHDGYTLGDFVRLATGKIERHDAVRDAKKLVTLSKEELKIHKLAALTLFSLQGPVMIHSGQEFARSKIIALTSTPDIHIGTLDHNSYDKDNETNYINYEHVDWNKELLLYYKGIINLKKKYPQLRKSSLSDLTFISDSTNEFAVGYISKMKDQAELLVFVNGSNKNKSEISIPSGEWYVLADGIKVYNSKDEQKIVKDILKLEPTEGIILVKSF
ncbi:MAG: pullulanase [Ignavibacteria bacterium]|nr:pullulanase [Ignavibacteria bacterium]